MRFSRSAVGVSAPLELACESCRSAGGAATKLGCLSGGDRGCPPALAGVSGSAAEGVSGEAMCSARTRGLLLYGCCCCEGGGWRVVDGVVAKRASRRLETEPCLRRSGLLP